MPQRRRHHQQRPAGFLAILVAVIALCVACGPVATAPSNALTSDEPVTPQATATPLGPGAAATAAARATASPILTRTPGSQSGADLVARIEALLNGRQGNYSVVVELRDGEVRYTNRPDEAVEAASLYKLAIMVELFAEREAGRLSFDDTITLLPVHFIDDNGEQFDIGESYPIGTLLHTMIIYSSNVAAAALLDRVGNDNINATMRRLGLDSTEIRWMPGGTARGLPIPTPSDNGEVIYNVTSARDMATLFDRLLAGAVISPEASAAMLNLLVQQTVNDRLPVLLPPEAIVAHKTGNLPGLYHDAGIIYTPNGPVVVAVLTESADEFEAVEFMAQLGLLLYESAP